VTDQARHGWSSDFPRFHNSPAKVIRGSLQDFILEAGAEQIRAWDSSIPQLQREVGEVLESDSAAPGYTAILEYELPMEARRPDVILLVQDAVVVLELKGKHRPSQADIDQASAYGRDLQCYHRECEGRRVMPILVPTLAQGRLGERSGVQIAGPDALDGLVEEFA